MSSDVERYRMDPQMREKKQWLTGENMLFTAVAGLVLFTAVALGTSVGRHWSDVDVAHELRDRCVDSCVLAGANGERCKVACRVGMHCAGGTCGE